MDFVVKIWVLFHRRHAIPETYAGARITLLQVLHPIAFILVFSSIILFLFIPLISWPYHPADYHMPTSIRDSELLKIWFQIEKCQLDRIIPSEILCKKKDLIYPKNEWQRWIVYFCQWAAYGLLTYFVPKNIRSFKDNVEFFRAKWKAISLGT